MTVRDLTNVAGDHPFILLTIFAALPLFAFVLGILHGKGKGAGSPWRYFYAILVYLSCFPGILAAVLTGYSIFFQNENMIDVNLLVYFLPIVSMTATLILIRKNTSFDEVPGFDRLSGLMAMIAVTFILTLAIQKTRIWLFFGGSIFMLIALVTGLFALLKWGAYMLFRGKGEAKIKPPAFPLQK